MGNLNGEQLLSAYMWLDKVREKAVADAAAAAARLEETDAEIECARSLGDGEHWVAQDGTVYKLRVRERSVYIDEKFSRDTIEGLET